MEKQKFKLLSIVVPVYNEEKYLETVVSKVIAQPLPGGLRRELILVNDGSQDNSWKIMISLPEKFSGINFQCINKRVNDVSFKITLVSMAGRYFLLPI